MGCNEWDAVTKLFRKGFCADQTLYPIAIRLFSAPPTSTSSECNWSTHGNARVQLVHTKTKNRLTNERVQKQVVIKSNMRFTPNFLEKTKTPRRNRVIEDDFRVDFDFVDDFNDDGLDVDFLDQYCESECSGSESDPDDSDHEEVPLGFLFDDA